MTKLNENKRKWVIQQFRKGRSATFIARIQKISRRYVYKLILKHKNEGERRNHPQTNGKMEKWFDTMKKRKKKHPEESFQDFIKWYNEKRIHHALEYKTPEEVYHEKL